MWEISIKCQSEEVSASCRNSLCDIYLQAREKEKKYKEKILQHFAQKCKKCLFDIQDKLVKGQDVDENSINVLNCLRLIKTFIQRYDLDHLIPELDKKVRSLAAQEKTKFKRIPVSLYTEGLQTEIEINTYCTFQELMRQASYKFNTKMSELSIKTAQGDLPAEVYRE